MFKNLLSKIVLKDTDMVKTLTVYMKQNCYKQIF